MTSQIIIDFFEQRRAAIIRLQQEKGLKATGRSAASLSLEFSENRYQLIDKLGYFEQQETGTPPPGASFEEIYEWLSLRKYGINWTSDQHRRRIAERIVLNHQKSGSYTWRRKQITGVLSESMNDNDISILLDRLAEHKVVEVKTDILGTFN